MLQKCHQLLKGIFASCRALHGRKGQTAVVMIIILAVGLILYAVTANLGRLSQYKVLTLKATEVAAARMGSLMASYGEKIFQEQLGGTTKVCGFTGVFSAFLIIIIIIIIVIITIISYGAGSSAAPLAGSIVAAAGGVGAFVVGAILSIIAAAVSLGLNAFMVDPKITELWNKSMNKLGPVDRFMEEGVQSALQAAVSDAVEIPDLYDYDLDGKFGDVDYSIASLEMRKKSAADYIPRFALFNTMRLNPKDALAGDPSVRDFMLAFNDLMIANGGTDWGFMDPLSCGAEPPGSHPCCPTGQLDVDRSQLPATMQQAVFSLSSEFSALCDPCCQPRYAPGTTNKFLVSCPDGSEVPEPPAAGAQEVCPGETPTDPLVTPTPLAPTCCYDSVSPCGNPSTCWARSPFNTGVPGNANLQNYPWVYDPLPPEKLFTGSGGPSFSRDTTHSFREMMGNDDEHNRYHVNADNPNWQHFPAPALPTRWPAGLAQDIASPPFESPDYENYTVADSSSFYAPPAFTPANPDANKAQEFKSGIFPGFYKMRDWAISYGSTIFVINYDGWGVGTTDANNCHWCDYTTAGSPYGGCSGAGIFAFPEERELTIPENNLQLPLSPISTAPSMGSPNPDYAYYSGGWCLDRVNLGAGGLPQVTDIIKEIDGLTEKPGNSACPLQANPAYWRSGTERYCSEGYPYAEGCESSNGYHKCSALLPGEADLGDALVPRDCECGEAGAGAPELFRNDLIDQILYDLRDLYFLYTSFANTSATVLRATIRDWWPDMADWIEPCCPTGAGTGACPTGPHAYQSCDGSFSDERREGRLFTWMRTLWDFSDVLEAWLNSTSVDNGVWCVPPIGSAGDLAASSTEQLTFDFNGNGIRGDVGDVVACLNWNASDTQTFIGTVGSRTATGNAQKFNACYDAITRPIGEVSLGFCRQATLPRSLIPGFNNAITSLQSSTGNPYFSNKNFFDHVENYLALSACRDTLPGGSVPSVPDCQIACAAPASFYDVYAPPWSPPVLVPPVTTLQATEWAPATSCTDPQFESDVVGAMYAARDALNLNNYPNLLEQSYYAAQNQVAKIQKRAFFLGGRYQEMLTAYTTIHDAYLRLWDFLVGPDGTWDESRYQSGPHPSQDSPAENLIAYRRRVDEEGTGLASTAIYVWKDPPGKLRNQQNGSEIRQTTDGYSHAVKVEARLPQRCNQACFADGDRWPWVRTYKPNVFRRCYKLESREGYVKVRVIRWDEEFMHHNAMLFPNGAPIWRPRYHHPLAGPGGVSNVWSVCGADDSVYPAVFHLLVPPAEWALPAYLVTNSQQKYFGDAFMLNRPPDPDLLSDPDPTVSSAELNYTNCWNAVHESMLRAGVVSETCVQYYYSHAGGFGSKGFKLRYVPCDADFLRGKN